MSQEKVFICFNNKFYEGGTSFLSLNRALKFGDGLFESIRIVDGKPRCLDYHFDRLQKGIALLRMDFSQSKWNEIKTCLTQLLIRNDLERGGVVRLTVFRAGGGKYLPSSNQLCYLIEAEPLIENKYRLNTKGLRLEISEQVFYPNAFSNFKTLNALPYIMASIEQNEKGADALLLKNKDGKIVECANANLFLVKGKAIYTPPLSDGCLAGVMRRQVISKLRSRGYSVLEESISSRKLLEVDEIFITNSIQGIKWVGAFDQKRYFNKTSKFLVDLLL